MTTKFKPFDPATAKNGDIVYFYCNEKKTYKYIGADVVKKDASVVHNDSGYGWYFNKHLQVAVPKRTVWINMYDSAYWYDSEGTALKAADSNNPQYRGTFPIEIDAE